MENEYFDSEPEPGGSRHPLIGVWEAKVRAGHPPSTVQVRRPREAFGYGPPELFVRFAGTEDVTGPVAWDLALDEWLVATGVRALSPSDEALRASFRLEARLIPLVEDWGDGYFNAVLVRVVRAGPYGKQPQLRGVLERIHTSNPHDSGDLNQRERLLKDPIKRVAQELSTGLSYSRESAIDLLEGAIVRYLDRRFHVSERRNLFSEPAIEFTDEKIGALAVAAALAKVLQASGTDTSSYFRDAVRNIEAGDRHSIGANWPVLEKQVAKVQPSILASIAARDAIVEASAEKLSGASEAAIRFACTLIASAVGGDAETYRKTWGQVPQKLRGLGQGGGQDPNQGL